MKMVRVVLLLCLLPLPVFGGVYKWVDADGRTHFGDRPPEQVSAQPVTVEPPPISEDTAVKDRQQRMTNFVEQSQQERVRRQAAAAKAAKHAKERARKCRRLQARVKFNESISSFYRVNDQGEREYYSDAEAQRIRERYESTAAQVCGD
ncbi:DUF4124 domain-containing protein [Marinobacter sp. CHS3-4]|uniref:DUF4124 domain-containing protein n=1 Tax=Marinobacter sp. CHS3-4 TaxID=3045174 RepID=UPI0024B5ABBD|nr:DUF4124 domain-containing protein [Marinobacter sp. CHS3-4]MDI9246436.1 DUF4124 domain-containing protein [Marinobacter sp. CHS3-4]